MRQEDVKIMKVIDELGTYFLHSYSATALDITLVKEEELFRVSMRVEGVHIAQETFQSLQKKLSQPRSPELEGYYWQLTGEKEDASELRLVAMMCDTIIMNYTEPVITLELIRRY